MNETLTEKGTPAKTADQGHAVYTGWSDWYYNFWVFRINCPFAWGVTLDRLVRFNRKHMSTNHLEVGVATSKVITRCAKRGQVLDILDKNVYALEKTYGKLSNQFRMEKIEASILEPIPLSKTYSSIALNFVMHCLPYDNGCSKYEAFSHVKPLLDDHGVLYGTTILGKGVRHNRFGQKLMSRFNKMGIFDNHLDTRDELAEALRENFKNVDVFTKNRVAFFAATNKRA